MSYVKKSKKRISFRMINEIEELAAREHGMELEEFATAKSAGERGLQIFCLPTCALTHNKGNLRFHPRIHLMQKPKALLNLNSLNMMTKHDDLNQIHATANKTGWINTSPKKFQKIN